VNEEALAHWGAGRWCCAKLKKASILTIQFKCHKIDYIYEVTSRAQRIQQQHMVLLHLTIHTEISVETSFYICCSAYSITTHQSGRMVTRIFEFKRVRGISD